MSKNPHDAQDLVQEAFIKVYQQLGKYDKTGSFSSWMYRVAINHCIDEDLMVSADTPELIFYENEESRLLERLNSRCFKWTICFFT